MLRHIFQSELTTLLKAEKTVHIQLMENIISTADEINMNKENWDALVIENRIKLNRHTKLSSWLDIIDPHKASFTVNPNIELTACLHSYEQVSCWYALLWLFLKQLLRVFFKFSVVTEFILLVTNKIWAS